MVSEDPHVEKKLNAKSWQVRSSWKKVCRGDEMRLDYVELSLHPLSMHE